MDIGTPCTLPEIGTDWLNGLRDCYIILSLKHSTDAEPIFWMFNNCGYTPYLMQCGIYHKVDVVKQPWYYNDGINAVAVPMTRTALDLLGLKITVNFDSLEQFANRSVPTVKASIGTGEQSDPCSDPTPADVK